MDISFLNKYIKLLKNIFPNHDEGFCQQLIQAENFQTLRSSLLEIALSLNKETVLTRIYNKIKSQEVELQRNNLKIVLDFYLNYSVNKFNLDFLSMYELAIIQKIYSFDKIQSLFKKLIEDIENSEIFNPAILQKVDAISFLLINTCNEIKNKKRINLNKCSVLFHCFIKLISWVNKNNLNNTFNTTLKALESSRLAKRFFDKEKDSIKKLPECIKPPHIKKQSTSNISLKEQTETQTQTPSAIQLQFEKYVGNKEWNLAFETLKSFYASHNKDKKIFELFSLDLLIHALFNEISQTAADLQLKITILNNLCVLLNEHKDNFLTLDRIKLIFKIIHTASHLLQPTNLYYNLFNVILDQLNRLVMDFSDEPFLLEALKQAHLLMKNSFNIQGKQHTINIKNLMSYVEPFLIKLDDHYDQFILDLIYSMYMRNYIPKDILALQTVLIKIIGKFALTKNISSSNLKNLHQMMTMFLFKREYISKRHYRKLCVAINIFLKKLIIDNNLQQAKAWIASLTSYVTFFPLELESDLLDLEEIFHLLVPKNLSIAISLFTLLKSFKESDHKSNLFTMMVKNIMIHDSQYQYFNSIIDCVAEFSELIRNDEQFKSVLNLNIKKELLRFAKKKNLAAEKYHEAILSYVKIMEIEHDFGLITWSSFLSLIHPQLDEPLKWRAFRAYINYETNFLNPFDDCPLMREACWKSIVAMTKSFTPRDLACICLPIAFQNHSVNFKESPSFDQFQVFVFTASCHYAIESCSQKMISQLLLEVKNEDRRLLQITPNGHKIKNIFKLKLAHQLCIKEHHFNGSRVKLICDYFDDLQELTFYSFNGLGVKLFCDYFDDFQEPYGSSELYYIREMVLSLRFCSDFSDFEKLTLTLIKLITHINKKDFNFLNLLYRIVYSKHYKGNVPDYVTNFFKENYQFIVDNFLNDVSCFFDETIHKTIKVRGKQFDVVFYPLIRSELYEEVDAILKNPKVQNYINLEFYNNKVYEYYSHYVNRIKGKKGHIDQSVDIAIPIELLNFFIRNFDILFHCGFSKFYLSTYPTFYLDMHLGQLLKLIKSYSDFDAFTEYFKQTHLILTNSFQVQDYLSFDCFMDVFPNALTPNQVNSFEIFNFKMVEKILLLPNLISAENKYIFLSIADTLLKSCLHSYNQNQTLVDRVITQENLSELIKRYVYSHLALASDLTLSVHVAKLENLLTHFVNTAALRDIENMLIIFCATLSSAEGFTLNPNLSIEKCKNLVFEGIQFLLKSSLFHAFYHATDLFITWFAFSCKNDTDILIDKKIFDLLLENLKKDLGKTRENDPLLETFLAKHQNMHSMPNTLYEPAKKYMEFYENSRQITSTKLTYLVKKVMACLSLNHSEKNKSHFYEINFKLVETLIELFRDKNCVEQIIKQEHIITHALQIFILTGQTENRTPQFITTYYRLFLQLSDCACERYLETRDDVEKGPDLYPILLISRVLDRLYIFKGEKFDQFNRKNWVKKIAALPNLDRFFKDLENYSAKVTVAHENKKGYKICLIDKLCSDLTKYLDSNLCLPIFRR